MQKRSPTEQWSAECDESNHRSESRRKEMLGCRSNMRFFLLSVGLLLLVSFSHNAVAQECELNCKSENCSPEGICICNLPTPKSVLTGNRSFLGGVFCDTPSVMCGRSNTFWCEAGGICNKSVQGENYTCTCPTGFAGEHCNFAGEICGDTYCYNGGICLSNLTANGICDCPPQFLGSVDCALPTPLVIPPAPAPGPAPEVSINSVEDVDEWWVPFGILVATILSVSCVCGLALRCHRQNVRRKSQARFHELRQVQMNDSSDFFDDDDDDSFTGLGNIKLFP